MVVTLTFHYFVSEAQTTFIVTKFKGLLNSFVGHTFSGRHHPCTALTPLSFNAGLLYILSHLLNLEVNKVTRCTLICKHYLIENTELALGQLCIAVL